MDAQRLNDLLSPFLVTPLPADQADQFLQYLSLLVKWNATMSLTGVRGAEQMVTRHFGESLFAAHHLATEPFANACDVGSGAGFPGVPIAISQTNACVILIESQQKKATFLRELVRTLHLPNVEVKNVRAEALALRSEVVTMRAVEKFEHSAPAAASLVSEGGRLGMLIGAAQVDSAATLLPDFIFDVPLRIPQSNERMLLVGRRARR